MAILSVSDASAAANIVELRLDKVYARVDLAGEAVFVWGNQTKSVPFSVGAGDALSLKAGFSSVPVGQGQSVTLVNASGSELLRIETVFGEAALTFVDSSLDADAIELRRGDASYRVVVGSVTGEFIVRVQYRDALAAAASTAILSVDANGDGELQPSEGTRLDGTAGAMNATVHLENVPTTTPWSLNVAHNGTLLAAYHGVLDWVDGSFVRTERDHLSDAATSVLASIEFTPRRTSVSGMHEVPNERILRDIPATPTGGALPKQGLVLTFGDAVVEPTPVAGNATTNVTAPSPAPPGVPGSLGALPIVLIVAAVAICGIGLAVMLARRRVTYVVAEQEL